MTKKKPVFATPQDVESAFYEALEHADLDAMMSVWVEDEEIICVHPGGPRLSGYAMVRESWRRIFEGGPRLSIAITHQVYLQSMLLSVHSVHEHYIMRGEDESAPMVATNVYVRGALGWRLLAHHASPAPPEHVPEAAKILH